MSDSRDACDFCGLPVQASWWPSASPETVTDEPRYCCFGCRFAAAVTREKNETGAARWTLTGLGISIFFTMNVMVFTMALWANDVYEVAQDDAVATTLSELFRWICLVCSLPVLLLLGIPLAGNAWDGLRRGVLSTDLLLISGVAAAYVYSGVSVLKGDGQVYFEVGCMVLVLVTLGRWLEATGRLKAAKALDELEKLLPETVRKLTGGTETTAPLAEVCVRDELRVLPGERFPTDGRLSRNSASVDEQLLTGESHPVEKHPGDPILAGTLNLDGDVLLHVTAVAGEGSFARLIEFLRSARQSRGHYQRLGDALASWFFPVMAAIALAACLYHGQSHSWERGILAGLSVVLIACPCALGLATPLAVWAAMGRAARAQILFQHGMAVEQLAGVRAICFDKTGTLTTGVMPVTHSVCVGDRDQILNRARMLADSSTHAISKAIQRYCAEATQPQEENVANIRALAGRGVQGQFSEETEPTLLGSLEFLKSRGLQLADQLSDKLQGINCSDAPMAYVGWSGQIRGGFVFEEHIRPEAAETVEQLRLSGYHLCVLTGDRRERGTALSDELEIEVRAELLPEEKVEAVREIRRQQGSVAMVGDGINDAPALAAADVGIAMGCGADVSREAATVCLLGNDLRRLPWAIDLAQKTVRVIRQNLIWAFAYNFFGVLLACTGRLNPAWAALLMAVSSFLVITNSLRLGSSAADRPLPQLDDSSKLKNNLPPALDQQLCRVAVTENL